MARFSALSALFLNCSLQRDASTSHTRRLLSRVAGIMDTEGVDVELLHVLGSDVPAGYDREFTNKNATIMTWNLMHTAQMLHERGGFPVGGIVGANWRDVTNAADQDPDAW